jgi:hypothetical protein
VDALRCSILERGTAPGRAATQAAMTPGARKRRAYAAMIDTTIAITPTTMRSATHPTTPNTAAMITVAPVAARVCTIARLVRLAGRLIPRTVCRPSPANRPANLRAGLPSAEPFAVRTASTAGSICFPSF